MGRPWVFWRLVWDTAGSSLLPLSFQYLGGHALCFHFSWLLRV